MKTEKQKLRSKMIIERLIKSPRLVWNPRYVMDSDKIKKNEVYT
jgi:hypothetical protein